MEAFFRLGVVEARASDGHAFNQLGVLYGEGQRPRVGVEGSGDRRRPRGSVWPAVVPVLQVVLSPRIPESDHGVGGVVVDGPLERERAGRGRSDERFAQGDRSRRLVDARDRGAGLDGVGRWGSVRRDAYAEVTDFEKVALRGLVEEMQSFAWR